MSKTKHRVTSVLLTLCLTVALLAGVLIAAPVQVKADVSGIKDILINPGDAQNPGDIYIEFTGVGCSITGGKSITVTDSNNVSYVYTTTAGGGVLFVGFGMLLSDFTNPIVFNPSLTYTITIEAGTFMDSATGTTTDLLGGTYTSTFYYGPTPAADAGTAEYYNRHYTFWYGALAQLQLADNAGTVTVDTSGHSIDMIMHFIFDALVDTDKTLVVKHQGQTYTINGQPHSADNLCMGSIMLGHNHAFSILGDYRT